jgi:hypothetical protein
MGKYNPKYEMIDKKTRSMLRFDNSPTNKGTRNTSPKEDQVEVIFVLNEDMGDNKSKMRQTQSQ